MITFKTDGYEQIVALVREGDSGPDGDPWGTNIDVLFALAEVIYAFTGESVPDFRPSPMLAPAGGIAQLDMDNYSVRSVASDYMDGIATLDDLKSAFTVLSRYDDWLRIAGRNY